MDERFAIRSLNSIFLKDIMNNAVLIEKSKSRDGKIIYIDSKDFNDKTLAPITFISESIEKYLDDYLSKNFILIQNRGVYIKKDVLNLANRTDFNEFGFFSLWHRINEIYEFRFFILTRTYFDSSFIKFLVENDLLDKKLLRKLEKFYLENLQSLEFEEEIFYFLKLYLRDKNKETLYLYIESNS